jgi:16S rRNA (adenine1518-N6/adenine1519-N6)-dimethyltransferase
MKKIGTGTYIKRVLETYNINIKKKYGQNFLIDQNILSNITKSAAITKDTIVVEIGPGLGSLTEHLLHQAKHVMAYEIDKDLIPILTKEFKDYPFTLHNKDFLQSPIDQDIQHLGLSYDKVIVVANLPYYITTPIIMKLLEESSIVTEYYVMMQLEVAKRFTSSPSTKDYNSLSVFMQYKTSSSIIMQVPKTVFIPAPNVDSAVVKILVNKNIKEKPLNESLFYKLVRQSFSMRRKTLVNNLSSSMGYSKDDIIMMLETLNINPRIRAEALMVSDFIKISDYLTKK